MEDPPRGQPEDRQVKDPGRASASRPSEAGTLRMSSGGRGSEWRSGKPQIDLVPPPRTRPDTGPPKSVCVFKVMVEGSLMSDKKKGTKRIS